MTLMSKTRYNFKQSFVCLVALLQLAVVPATYCLHIDCEHGHDDVDHSSGFISTIVSCFVGHHCDCSEQVSENNRSEELPSKSHDSEAPHTPEAPHDSHTCSVCQTAFAMSVAEFSAPVLADFGTVSVPPPLKEAAPASAERYRNHSRGPPVFAAVS